MKRGTLLLAVVLTLSLLVIPLTRISYASTEVCNGVTFELQPDEIDNRFEARVTITNDGTAFDGPNEPWVDIVGSGPGRIDPIPGTLSQSSFTIEIPSGIDTGIYDVVIRDLDINDVPDGFCRIENGLQITGPQEPNFDIPEEDDEDEEEPTSTPLPTQFVRPLVLVPSYGASTAVVEPGQSFEVQVNLRNEGQLVALNVVADFQEGDLKPRNTGGILADTRMEVGENASINQILTVESTLTGDLTSVDMELTYTDEFGTEYVEIFTLVFDLNDARNTLVTATPTTIPPSQVLVTNYETDAPQLAPGTIFTLELDIQNLGESSAQDVTMILGGTGTEAGEGGIAGAGGTFDNFAPVGASNVQRLADIPINGTLQATQQFVVNTSAQPGAYPLTVSFVYTNEDGNSVTDSQVITLLVFRPLQLDIAFYRTPASFMVGEQTILPIQIANLGNTSVTLGNLRVSSETASIENNNTLIGQLDSGSFFTFDAGVTPDQAGTIRIQVTIDYTDDFGAPQTIERIFNFEVAENPALQEQVETEGDLPLSQDEAEQGPEGFGGIMLRFIRGIFGLDSARQGEDE